MKKGLVLLLFVGIITCANAQNIIQITNNNNGSNNNTQKDCNFKINGVCSSEDIGGVSLEEISRVADDPTYVWSNGTTSAILKNYNNFTVTVLMQLLFDTSGKVRNPTETEEVYQVVLQPNETKTVALKHCNCPSCYSLQGMIVRRLKN